MVMIIKTNTLAELASDGCKYSFLYFLERILKLTSVKVSSGELKDESTTISQFGRGSNESKPLQLRLREDDTQEKKPSGGSSPQKRKHFFVQGPT